MTSHPTPAASTPGTHPIADEFLLDYATGAAPEPIAVLVATHATLKPEGRAAIGRLEATGGALLDGVVPAALRDDALDHALARLGPQDGEVQRPAGIAPPDARLPGPLRDYLPQGIEGLRWRRLGGIAEAVLPCAEATPYKLSLLRIGAGRAFPRHGHSGTEMLLVLDGGFADEHGHYVRGDVCHADEAVEHRPVADPDGECLCLAVTRGPIRLKGLLGLLLAPFLRG